MQHGDLEANLPSRAIVDSLIDLTVDLHVENLDAKFMVELVWRFWKDKEFRETNDRLMMKRVFVVLICSNSYIILAHGLIINLLNFFLCELNNLCV